MGIRKEFDWVGENLSNPGFTNTDFKDNGVNILNTSIAPEEVYLNNPQIRADAQFLTNGRFDPYKFHEKYVELALSYNDLAKDTFDRDIKYLGKVFSENNIFVSPEERRLGSTTYMTLMDNPDHINFGIVGIDLAGPRTKTAMELAELLPIYDSLTGKFTDYTAEDSFFRDFWRPMMLATYDTDVDQFGNPTTDPNKIAHFKGERKLNADGEYYLEFVNGKSTYGKELLSKWNILTKEDSPFNKYDPFDSDDIHKSTAGSIARNALKILPLFTPVAPYYAAASIGINLVDALGTLGKLVMGSNNSTLNNITAFAESFNQTTSEEGMQKTFGLENVINMVGDTFMFLESLRILAELAPRLFMKDVPKTREEQKEAIEKLATKYKADLKLAIDQKYRQLPVVDPARAQAEYFEELRTAAEAADTIAIAEVNNMIENFNKLGRQISTSTMAITFGLHTYGTAKAEGVSDEAATALTLGAIAGLYGLLSSHIGLKIFPEANIQRQQVKKALLEMLLPTKQKGNLAQITDSLVRETTKEGKTKSTLSLMKKGRELAEKIWGVNGTVAGTVAANTVATSIEMTGFTALDDVIASIYNLGAWLSGEDNRMSAWENIPGRYGSSLLGGAIAGAMSTKRIYNAALNLRNMQTPEALETIAHLINEGKSEEIKKIIRNNTWGNIHLSAKKIAEKEFGPGDSEDLYGTGTYADNLDLEAKQVMLEVIDNMEKILTTYGAKIDSNSLLNVMVNGKNISKDLRFALLKRSNVALMYLKEFVSNQVKIYDSARKLSHDPKAKLEQGRTDAQDRAIDQEAKSIKSNIPADLKDLETATTDLGSPQLNEREKARQDLKDALETNKKFMNGEKGKEFLDLALFEMLYGINAPYYDGAFREFAEHESNKKYDELTLQEKRKLAKTFYDTNTGELGMINLRMAYNAYNKSNKAASEVLKQIKDNADALKDLQKIAEEVKEFVRKDLFLVEASENEKPYDLDSILRPESYYLKNFVLHAADKLWQDRQSIIETLRKRYKGEHPEIDKAIEDFMEIHKDFAAYMEFLHNTKAKVDAQQKKLEQWSKRKKAAEENGEEFTEELPETAEFNTEYILNELATARGIRQAVGAAPGFEDRISKLIQNIRTQIEEAESPTGKSTLSPELVNVLKSLYWTLTDPRATKKESFYSQMYLGEVIGLYPLYVMQSMIEGMFLKTIASKFVRELLTTLNNNVGFLDNETKDILAEVLNVFKANTSKVMNISGLFDPTIGFDNIKNVSDFNLLEALELVDPERFTKHKKVIEALEVEANEGGTELFFLPEEINSAIDTLKAYQGDSILKVADKLMKTLKFSDTSVTDILNALLNTIKSKTLQTVSIMTPSRININEFILKPTAIKDIENAILVLLMIRSSFISADGEVRSSMNSVGFNPTANLIHNLTGEDAYAVLSSSLVAEHVLYIQDTIYKLMYWKEVAAHAMKLRAELTDLADLGFQINAYSQITDRIRDLKDSEVKWKDLDKFETTILSLSNINNLQTLKALDRITNLEEETKEAIREEYIRFEMALHDFLNANQDIISNPKKLVSLVNEKSFALSKGNDFSAITLEDKLNDNIALVYYIASVGALDPRIYYSNLKKSLKGQRLPVVTQNTWMYQGAAMALNREYIGKFVDAIVEAHRQQHPDLDSSDAKAKAEAQEKYIFSFLATGLNPSRRNMYLVESGPGSGKTFGYLPELFSLLFQIDPALDLNKDLWIAGPEDTVASEITNPAKKIGEAIGSTSAKVFTRDSLMEYILKDFAEYESKFKVIDGKIQVKDENGKPPVFELDVNTGKPKIEYTLNDGITELPKLIVIDEISDYSEFDLDILQDFAEKHNITILASGDFTQSGIYGDIKVKFGETETTSTLKAWSCQFVRSFKSLLSFRTTNTQSDHNNSLLRVFFENWIKYAESSGTKNINLIKDGLELTHYFDKESGNLFGTYISDNDDGRMTDLLKEYITGIYKSIENDPNKTVTFLFTDENSEIYKFINAHEGSYDWTKKTSFRKGTTLKGIESTYYIIDLDPNIKNEADNSKEAWSERERVARELYTALTRQKLGAILIPRYRGKMQNFDVYGRTSDDDTREISMSPEFIEKRTVQLSALLETLFPEVVPANMKVGAPTSNEVLPTVGPSGAKPVVKGAEKNYKVEEGEEFLYQENFDDKTYSYHQQVEEDMNNSPMSFYSDGSTITYFSKTANDFITIPQEGCIGVLNTFNALRTGLANKEGKLVLENNPERRDNLYGIYHIALKIAKNGGLIDGFNTNKTFDPNNVSDTDLEEIQTLITRLSTIAKTRNNEDILKEFKRILGLAGNKNIYMRWIFAGALTENTKGYPRSDIFAYDFNNEKGFGGKGKGENNNKISRKELYLVIGEDGKEGRDILLTLPVATLPNYRTILNKNKTLRESVVGKKYRELSNLAEAELARMSKDDRISKRNSKIHEVDDKFAKYLLDYLRTTKNPVEGAAFLFKLIDMWMVTSEFVSFMPGEYLLAKTATRGNLRFMGPFLLTANRGYDYLVPGYEQDQTDTSNDWKYLIHDLANLQRDVDISKVYTAQSQYKSRYCAQSGFMIKSGAYYVLVAPKGEFRNAFNAVDEAEMFRYFLQLLTDPEHTPIKVKLLAVRPPKADIDSFMDSELVLLTQSPDKETRPHLDIGNLFTAFRIIQRMFNDCEENGSDKLNSIIGSNITLRQGTRVNIGNVKEHVLRLTYLEGLMNPEKKDLKNFNKVYELSEKELSNEQKVQIRNLISDPNNKDLDFIALANNLMRESSGFKYNIRNSFRYALLYMWFAEDLKLPLLWGNEVAKNYIADVVKDYSILYNPTYKGASEDGIKYFVEMEYEGSSEKERFTFYKTNTDLETGAENSEPYLYQGKNFQYAAEIINGPLYGDITSVLDSGLKGFKGKKSNGVLWSPQVKSFVSHDAKDTLFDAPREYFKPEEQVEIDLWLKEHDGIRGLKLEDSPYYSLVLGYRKNPVRVIFKKDMIRAIVGGPFDKINPMSLDSDAAKEILPGAEHLRSDQNVMFNVKIGDDYKYFLLSKVGGRYEINEIGNKPSTGEANILKATWDTTLYNTTEDNTKIIGVRDVGNVRIAHQINKADKTYEVNLVDPKGMTTITQVNGETKIEAVNTMGREVPIKEKLDVLQATKTLLEAEAKEPELIKLLNEQIDKILSIIETENNPITYNIDELKTSSNVTDNNLATLAQEDFGITDINFSANTFLEAMRSLDIPEEEFAATIIDAIGDRELPTLFIEEINKLLNGAIKRTSEGRDDICNTNILPF